MDLFWYENIVYWRGQKRALTKHIRKSDKCTDRTEKVHNKSSSTLTKVHLLWKGRSSKDFYRSNENVCFVCALKANKEFYLRVTVLETLHRVVADDIMTRRRYNLWLSTSDFLPKITFQHTQVSQSPLLSIVIFIVITENIYILPP